MAIRARRTRSVLGIAFAVLVITVVARSDAEAQPRVRVDGNIASIDFSLDGKWMAVGHDVGGKGVVSLFSAKYRSRPPVVLPALGHSIRFVGFLDRGELVAAADSRGTIVVWRVPAGREVYRIDVARRAGEGASVVGMANPAAPYIGWLVTAAGKQTGKVEVARVPGGQIVTAVDKITAGAQVRWSRHGEHLLLGGTALNWDTLEQWRPKLAGVSATSPDGARVVTTSPTACDGFLSIAEVGGTKKVLRSIPIGKDACPEWLWFTERGLAWIGPTGEANQRAVFTWDEKRDRQRRVSRLDLEPKVVAVSGDLKFLAISDGLAVRYVFLR